MTNEEYIKAALVTESPIFNDRILHAVMGLVTESGEMLDALKKKYFYGKEIDRVNLVEEAGDIFWYLAVLADELGVCFEDIMLVNIKKLSTRYPDKFSAEKAVNRNLQNERKVLENSLGG